MPFDGSYIVSKKIQHPGFLSRVVRFFRTKKQIDKSIKIASFLLEAKSFIADPEHWSRFSYAYSDGNKILRCAVGALRAVRHYEIQDYEIQQFATWDLLSIAKKRGFLSIESMNDNSTHAEVMSAFDEAIFLEKWFADDSFFEVARIMKI